MPEDAFDAVLTQPVRLGVVSVLVGRREATFSELKELLGVTQGNLGIHLQKLEDAGYLKVVKKFVARKPRTTVSLTRRGRAAFLGHVERLNRIAGQEP